MTLSANFTLRELTVSANRPDLVRPIPADLMPYARRVATTLLQPIRNHAGRAVRVLSCYRSPALNKAIGGSPTSQHIHAQAADFTTADVGRIFADLVAGRLNLVCGQVIYYPDRSFVHVALPSSRCPGPLFQVQYPTRGYRYCWVTSEEQLARLLA